jgi:hypothetical protein
LRGCHAAPGRGGFFTLEAQPFGRLIVPAAIATVAPIMHFDKDFPTVAGAKLFIKNQLIGSLIKDNLKND